MTGGRTNGVAGDGSSGDGTGPAPLRLLCVDDNALDLERMGRVTTSMRGSDRDRADTLGADAYLVKALTSDGLVSTLDEVRRRRASGAHRA